MPRSSDLCICAHIFSTTASSTTQYLREYSACFLLPANQSIATDFPTEISSFLLPIYLFILLWRLALVAMFVTSAKPLWLWLAADAVANISTKFPWIFLHHYLFFGRKMGQNNFGAFLIFSSPKSCCFQWFSRCFLLRFLACSAVLKTRAQQ